MPPAGQGCCGGAWGGVGPASNPAGLRQGFSDGPIGPIPAGRLRSGALRSEAPVDWSFANDLQLAQLQLVNPLASRTTGILVYEGDLYVPCDLGFSWRRVAPPAKWLMALVWRVKRWHQHALRDGRAVVRIRGKRYEREAVRETDPQCLAALNGAVEERARSFLSSPLKETPADHQCAGLVLVLLALVAGPAWAQVPQDLHGPSGRWRRDPTGGPGGFRPGEQA